MIALAEGNSQNNDNSCGGVTMSPAVVSSYVEVLRRYVGTYLDTAHSSVTNTNGTTTTRSTATLYTHALEGGTAVLHAALTLAVHTLHQMPYDAEATGAVCALLDTLTERRAAVWSYVAQHDTHAALWACALPHSAAHDETAGRGVRRRLPGNTRGRLLAFLLTGAPSPAAAEAAVTASVEPPPPPHMGQRRAGGEEDDDLREVLESVEGLCGALRTVELTPVVCALLARRVRDDWLLRCHASAHNRHLAVALLRAVRSLLRLGGAATTAAGATGEADVVTALVHVVGRTMSWAAVSVSSWSMRTRRAGGGHLCRLQG